MSSLVYIIVYIFIIIIILLFDIIIYCRGYYYSGSTSNSLNLYAEWLTLFLRRATPPLKSKTLNRRKIYITV